MDVWVAGQDAQFRDLVASLTRILLISPAIFAVSTFCSSVLNSYNRFAIAAMAPLPYNLAIIRSAWGLSGPLGIYGLALGAVVRLSWPELALIVLTASLVLVVEALNTALETMCDLVSPDYHPLVKRAKDISAAAVLIAALGAVTIALLLFLPRFM